MKVTIVASLAALANSLAVEPARGLELAEREETWAITSFSLEIGRQDLGGGWVNLNIGTNFGLSDTVDAGGSKGYSGGVLDSHSTKGASYQMWCDVNKGGPSGLNECAVGRWVCVNYDGKRCGHVWLKNDGGADCTDSGKTKNNPVNCRTQMKATNLPLVLHYQG